MSSRDDILAASARNQPARRALPEVPTFERPLADRRWPTFKAGLQRMGGTFVDAPSAATLDALVRAQLSRRQGDLLGHPGSRRAPRAVDARAPPGGARRRRRRRRARRVRRRRDRLGAAQRARVRASTRSASCRSTWSCCSTRRSSSPTCTTPTGTEASRGALRRVHDRPVGHRRHRGRPDPRRAGHPHAHRHPAR